MQKTVSYHGTKWNNYTVDGNGNIHNILTGKCLKTTDNVLNGYPRVSLSNNGVTKHLLVHRIVAEAFVEMDKPCESITNSQWKRCPKSIKQFIMKNMLVNHIDHDKQNYSVKNLEWVTAEENSRKRVEFYGR
jgi:hypothetical protein